VTWQDNAACAGAHIDLFFPPTEITRAGIDPYAAGRIYCRDCPVQLECLAAALAEETDAKSRYGLRSLTPVERTALARHNSRNHIPFNVTIPPPASNGPLTADQTTARKQLHAQGCTDADAGRILGIAPNTYNEWRTRAGLPTNTAAIRNRLLHEQRYAMHAQGKTDAAIGEATNATPTAVRKWRVKQGLDSNNMLGVT
jgi:hypothetical protein